MLYSIHEYANDVKSFRKILGWFYGWLWMVMGVNLTGVRCQNDGGRGVILTGEGCQFDGGHRSQYSGSITSVREE